MPETLQLRTDGAVTILTLDRPARLNALTVTMLDEMTAALDEVAASDARALVLHGAGRGFCAGADLRALTTELDLTDLDAVRDYVTRWGRNVERISTLPQPSVAAVHGVAYGGGFSIAIACDLLVAAEDARFNTQYVNLGLNPDLGSSWVLPRRIGGAAARALFLRGNEISGRRAHELGLVAELVADADAVLPAARAVAHELAGREPAAIATTRRLLDAAASTTLAEAVDAEAEGLAVRFATASFAAVLESFGSRDARPATG
jgi:2-(1,2-epoxy-1,2-dihydrophenyl)acetyl-CoA isomerase